MCFVCGLDNEFGLKASFYELENGELAAIFQPRNEHQSYPGRMHGGLVGALLDETIGRAIMIKNKDGFWGVSIEINIRYKKPVLLGVELKVIGRITSEQSRTFEGSGEIYLPDGEVAASGSGKFLKMPLEKITDPAFLENNWHIIHSEADPHIIDY